MLFGDGAGAVVLSVTDGPSAIGPIVLRSDTRGNAAGARSGARGNAGHRTRPRWEAIGRVALGV
jgi:3-oxoacyl-[acyl-carrier-protein] synthase III